MVADGTVLAVDRDAREVAHVLVRARELVEQRGLAAVLVARQGKADGVAGGDGHLAAARGHALAQGGVGTGLAMGVCGRHRVGVMDVNELDARGVCPAQGELVAAQAYLHGVAHGCVLHHGDLGAGRQAHVEDVLAQRRIIRCHRGNDRVLANLQRVESHVQLLLANRLTSQE